MTIDNDSLAAFRFQDFFEDVIIPVLPRTRAFPTYDSLGTFAIGELREAVAVTALGTACNIFPRELFEAMLRDFRFLLNGEYQRSGSVQRIPEYPPPPVSDLPDSNRALEWSRTELQYDTIQAMPEIMENYASLMRQVHRNDSHRLFNARLIFAQEERWQEDIRPFQSTMIPWITGAINEPESAWLPEGLDSFFDLAEDLGVTVHISASGQFVGFDFRTATDIDIASLSPGGPQIIARAIAELNSMLPLMTWRFGGQIHAEQVVERVASIQSLTSTLVAMVESGLSPITGTQPRIYTSLQR